MNMTREVFEQRMLAARQQGFNEGVIQGRKNAAEDVLIRRRDAFINLTNAVGQALNTNASLMEGLSRAFDNAGGV